MRRALVKFFLDASTFMLAVRGEAVDSPNVII